MLVRTSINKAFERRNITTAEKRRAREQFPVERRGYFWSTPESNGRVRQILDHQTYRAGDEVDGYAMENSHGFISEENYKRELNPVPGYGLLYKDGNRVGRTRQPAEHTSKDIDTNQNVARVGRPNNIIDQRDLSANTAEKIFQSRFIGNEPAGNLYLARAVADSYASSYNIKNLNGFVFMAIIVDFLDICEYNARFLRLFKGFCKFIPKTLVFGFIYLKRYTYNFDHRFKSIDQLVKMYLACCILAKKYDVDAQLFNVDLISGWGIDPSEMNFCEALVLNTLNYDLFISMDEYEYSLRYIKRNGYSFYSKLQNITPKLRDSTNKL